MKMKLKIKNNIIFLILFSCCCFFCNKKILATTPEMVLKNMKLLTPEIKEEQRYIIPQNFSHT